MTETWILEYSPTQGSFHIDLLENAVKKNQEALLNDRAPDFIPIGQYTDYVAASACALAWRYRLQKGAA